MTFIRHEACPECGSKDNLAVYEDGGKYCFGCHYTVPSLQYLEDAKTNTKIKVRSAASSKADPVVKEKTVSKELITEEQNQELKDKTELSGNGYRGISDEVLKFYGCRTEYDGDEVYARYYPYTIEGKLAGYKCRVHPKVFGGNIGNTGKDCDLYGQFRFNKGKYILVVEGEEDAHAAYQMFLEYARSKNSDFVTAVVSLGLGVGSHKQLANNYEFLNNFEHIILGFDSDDAGSEALDKAIAVLPKGKVKIAKWTKDKDPNEYLKKNNAKQFLADFYNAQTYVPAGVLGSNKLYDRMMEQTRVEKLPFPSIMKELNDMLAGGLSLGHIYNIAAGTGIGKTSLINEIIYHWIFNSPHTIGIVSMELAAGQYAEAIYSRHVSRKLAMMQSEEKIRFLESDRSRNLGKVLFETEDGSPRFYLCEDRDGSVEQLQDVIEQMVISSGCKVIVIDPLQDVLDGLSIDEQAVFLKWAKSMIKSHGIAFIFINHKRKSGADAKSGDMEEDDIHGSSTIIKSASANILLSRNKTAEDEIERNTTKIKLSKNRLVGLTGPAGELYYDNYTHTLHRKVEYFADHPELIKQQPTKEKMQF